MVVRWGNLTCHLRISYQGQLPPPTNHRQSHLPRRGQFSPHPQSLKDTPEPDGSITAPTLDEIPEEIDSENNDLYRRFPKPHTLAQDSDSEEADPEETPMHEENLEIMVYHTARRTFSDDPDYNEFRDPINKSMATHLLSQRLQIGHQIHRSRLSRSQIDCHFNDRGCKVSEHLS